MIEHSAYVFLSCFIISLEIFIALLFVKLWKNTGDRLFSALSLSFALLGAERILLTISFLRNSDSNPIYVLRIIAFALIIGAFLCSDYARPSLAKGAQRILLLTTSFPRWEKDDLYGRFILECAKQLSQKYEVLVLAPRARGSEKREEWDGIQIFRHKQAPGKFELAYGSGIIPNLKKNPALLFFLPFFLMFQFLAMVTIVKKNKIDIIHANWIIPQAVQASLYKLLFDGRIRIIGTCHGSEVNQLAGRLWRWIRKFIFTQVDGLTVVGGPLEKKIRSEGYKGPLAVIPMGVDIEECHPCHRDAELRTRYNARPLIVYAGSCIEAKGVRTLYQAMHRVLQVMPDAKLLCFGNGTLRDEMELLTLKDGLSKKIHFANALQHDELIRHLASADLFVLPSFADGFSVTVAEALACECPAIISDKVGILDFVKEKLKNGQEMFLYEVPAHREDLLAEKIIETCRRLEKSAAHRKLGRDFVVKNLRWDVIGLQFRSVFEEWAGERMPPVPRPFQLLRAKGKGS